MSEADLRVVHRWLLDHPGHGLAPSDVPGASADELASLASLGGLCGIVLCRLRPELADPVRLGEFCGGNDRVTAWFTATGCPQPPDEVITRALHLLAFEGEDGLARLYSRVVRPERRRRLGTFFTPRAEVTRMLDSWALRQEPPSSVVDVGAGVGIYTVAAASRWPESTVFAIDVNPVTLGLLALRVADGTDGSDESGGDIVPVLDDFTAWITRTWSQLPPPRLVLGNPPYTRMQLLPERARSDLIARAGGLLGRRASLASLMTAISLLLLGPDDGLCMLLPAQWLESDYAEGMRRWLWAAEQRRVELRLFSSDLFVDAEVDAVSLLVGPRGDSPQDMGLAVDGTGETVELERTGPCPPRWRGLFAAPATGSPTSLRGAAVATRPDAPLSHAPVLLDGRARLNDFARVNRGVATGSNRFFVLTEAQRVGHGIPAQVVERVVRRLRDREGLRNVAWVHDPDPQGPSERTVGEMAWLLVTGSEPCDARVREYLERGAGAGVDSSVLAGQREDWYDLSGQVKHVDVALSPMSKGVFRVLQTPPEAAILNNLYGLRWREDVPPDYRTRIVGFLTSPSGQEALRETARSQANGLLKIEPGALSLLDVSAAVGGSGPGS